ncbi:hypothetical protein WME77_27095 [Sorangium sp. So ce764]
MVRYPGTYMYHSHFDEMTQIALGGVGMFIVHPSVPPALRRLPRGSHAACKFSSPLHRRSHPLQRLQACSLQPRLAPRPSGRPAVVPAAHRPCLHTYATSFHT